MLKKKMKSNPLESDALTRSFGVVLEDINSKFDLVLEGHEVLDKKIDGVKDKLTEFKKETRDNFRELFDFRKETKENFKAVFDYLSLIDNELKDIKLEITDLKTRLDSKADLKRLELLEERVKKLEIAIAQQANK